MDSAGLHVLTKNFTHLTAADMASLRELTSQYPYSQLLHLMLSRAAQDLHDPAKDALLHTSAVYATDRAVLKQVMTLPKTEHFPPPVQPAEQALQLVPEVKLSPAPHPEQPPAVNLASALTGDALRNDVYLQLEKLKKSKHDFEASVEDYEKEHPVGAETKPKLKSPKEVSDPLLEEIKSTKKKLKVDNPKQKEQNEIIDQFIKTQPVIPKAKPVVPDTDLSEDSSVFTDNIVSETLVAILLKQGKKDKAIEVLKKLIWKFPQKKAYFAAQIDGLKS